MSRPRQLGDALAGAAHVFADALHQFLARCRIRLVGELLDEEGEVVQRVLHVVRDGGCDHPDRLTPFGSGQPLGEHLRRRALGGVELSRPLREQQRPGQQHACQRRRDPVDENDHPAPGALLEPCGGKDVVEACQEQADEKADHDQRNGAAVAAHGGSVTDEMSHLRQFWRRIWNRACTLYC